MKLKYIAEYATGWQKIQVLRDCKKYGKKCGNMQMCPPAGLQARRRTATEATKSLGVVLGQF